MKSNTRKLVLCFVLLAIIWVAPAGVGVGLVVVNVVRLPGGREDMLQAIRDRGEPATFDDLDALYPQVPDEMNAALVYQQAFDAFRMPTYEQEDLLPIIGHAELPPAGEPLDEKMLEAVEQHLLVNLPALQLLHAAAQYESCRFEIDYSVENTLEIPHLHQLEHASNLFTLEAIIHMERDRSANAVTALIDKLAIARVFEREPFYGSYLHRSDVLGGSVATLRRVLNRIPLSKEQLSALGLALEGFDHQKALYRATVAERCETISRFDDYNLVPGMKGSSLRYYAEFAGRVVEASQLPFPQALDMAAELDAEKDAQMDEFSLFTLSNFSAILALSAPEAEFKSAARTTASHACARIAVAIEQYRLDHGALPEALDELVPMYLKAVPTDPFDGANLRYQRPQTGYLLYSIDWNREDDGGHEEDDWVFEVGVPVSLEEKAGG